MAASITHFVVGERVFNQAPYFDKTAAVHGAFLLGCVLVDVHAFHNVNRRQTHFVGRLEDGSDSYSKSCSGFLEQYDALLRRPWNDMTQAERAFVMGYLCHLAVDECWKDFARHLFQKLGITSWVDLPVPSDVLLTAFDFLSRKILIDPAVAFAALKDIQIPDVFNHVPHEILLHQWRFIHKYVISDGTPGAYIKMLEDAGKPIDKIQDAELQHQIYWESAIQVFDSMGGVLPFIKNAVAWTINVIPKLWISFPSNTATDVPPGK